jgi:phosphatidylserine decarboxylase
VAVFARGSLPWLAVPLGLALLLGALAAYGGMPWLRIPAIALLAILLFLMWFFRDPDRVPAHGVVSAADGKVVRTDKVDDADLGPCDRLSVFMSPTDVHVNRFPLDGKVLSVVHHPGSHIPAWDKDSERNERVVTTMDTTIGRVKVIQIAGTLARRIVPYVQGGQTHAKGDRLGLIRLGSRCDLLVPEGRIAWDVKVGDRVKAGTSTVAAGGKA